MIKILVLGACPAPKGSKSFKGMIRSKKTGRQIPRLVESAERALKPWSETVQKCALVALDRTGHGGYKGPLWVEITFFLPRPKGGKYRDERYPQRKPDLDKLERATFDALTAAHVWEDDSRIVRCCSAKCYADSWSHNEPGALILIYPAR